MDMTLVKIKYHPKTKNADAWYELEPRPSMDSRTRLYRRRMDEWTPITPNK